MPDIKKRVSELEMILGEYMAQNALAARRSEAEMREFKAEMLAFKDEMREFKDEMLEFKDEMGEFKDEMREFKDEMLEFKDEMRGFKDEMGEFKDEMRGFKNEMNKKWGELANKLGTVVEDIVAPNIPTIAKKYFGIDEYDHMMVNPYMRNSKDPSKRKEFDVVLVAADTVVLNETKTTVKQGYMENFANSLPEFFDYFPGFSGKKLIPVFSSLSFRDEQVRFLSKVGIYAIAMTGSTMDVLNFEEIKT